VQVLRPDNYDKIAQQIIGVAIVEHSQLHRPHCAVDIAQIHGPENGWENSANPAKTTLA
jgi:hypothetical protein